MKNIDRSNSGPSNDASLKCSAGIKAQSYWNWVEVTLLLLGVVLLIWFAVARFESHITSGAALKNFDSFSATSDPSEAAAPVEANLEPISAAEPDFEGWNERRVRAYRETAANRTDSAIAVLEIPEIHLVAPVMEGTDSLTLNHAVGRIGGTARPGEEGNIGLAAHRDSFFRGLKDIKPGDTVELRTRGGKDIYIVDRSQIVTPNDVSVLRQEPVSSLTLVTCYPFYFIGRAPKRFVVTAYLTRHIQQGQATTEPQAN